MRIGIEAQRIFRKNKHGMDYVVLEEIRELQRTDKTNEYFIYVKPGEDECLHETERVHIRLLQCPSYPLWEQVALPMAARHDKVQLLHCTSNTAPIVSTGVPLILTLHDIIFLEKRDKRNKSLYQNLGWMYRRAVVPRVLRRCQKIITVSDFERNNIINTLALPADRIVRIYNGYNEWFCPDSTSGEAYKRYIDAPGYFFFLGNTDPKKNTERTLAAYAKYIAGSGVRRKLLVADLSAEHIREMLRRQGVEDIAPYIVAPGYIVNADLPDIYRGAFAFLYTSLRESFGIPLLEAMACGVPVITSSTSSMPEIAGGAGAFIDPESPESIAAMMLRLEDDTDYYADRRAAGIERVKLFSWKRTAAELLRLYEKTAGEGEQ